MKHGGFNDNIAAPVATPVRDYVDELGDILRELGVAEELIEDGEARVYLASLTFAAERWRELAMGLPNDPRSRALRVAMLGLQEGTFESHARETGTTRGNLFRGVQRMKAHLAKTNRGVHHGAGIARTAGN